MSFFRKWLEQEIYIISKTSENWKANPGCSLSFIGPGVCRHVKLFMFTTSGGRWGKEGNKWEEVGRDDSGHF